MDRIDPSRVTNIGKCLVICGVDLEEGRIGAQCKKMPEHVDRLTCKKHRLLEAEIPYRGRDAIFAARSELRQMKKLKKRRRLK